MKVMFDGRILGLTLSGVAEHLLNLVNYLSNEGGLECILIGPKEIENNPYLKKVKIINFDRPRKVDLKEIYIENFVLSNIIEKVRPDIYHVALNWGIPRNLSCKTILTIHDVIPFKILEGINLIQLQIYKFLIKNSVKRASKIITISNFSKKDIIETLGVDDSKIEMIYNGLTVVPKPDHLKQKLADIKKQLNIKKDFLMAVGGFFERKNMPRVIKAFAMLRNKDLDYQLIIPGKNKGNGYIENQFALCQKIVKDSSLEEDVLFPGYLDRETLETLLSESKILLYPSLYEGFGLPILEAMSAKVPTLTSNLTCLPEVAQDASHLVNPYKTSEIYEGMKKILTDKEYQESLIQRGSKRVSDFSWKKMGEETLKLYEQV